MNSFNLLNNSITQTDSQPAHPTQVNAADSNAARDVAVSAMAITQIVDANTTTSAPLANSRSPSPHLCLVYSQTSLERFEEELRLWCEEKSGAPEYQKRLRAKERMVECFKTSSAILDLYCLGLTSLPNAIGMLVGLRRLNLSSNQLTSLPDEVGLLTGLQFLGLSHNKFTSFPTAIGSLTSLQTLNLSHNELTSFSFTIGALRNLRFLNLSHNELISFPIAIGSLRILQLLNLSHNQLALIPATIGFLGCLKSLNLSHNQLVQIPITIGFWEGLFEFNLSHNQLTSIPDTIYLLRGLQSLNLSHNQFTSLSPAIGLLTGLYKLKLSRNRLTSLPDTIGALRQLQVFDLEENHLTSLPETIGFLSNLHDFNLLSNQLTALPDTISLLTSLQILDLTNNRLTSLPVTFGLMTGLQDVRLTNNELTSLPISILSLSESCLIELHNTALSARVLTHLREETERAGYNGPEFVYSMSEPAIMEERPLAMMISELYQIIDQPSLAFPNLEAIDSAQHLRSWINRLSWTATYQREGDAQRQFVSQIVRYLETAEKNETFRLNIFMPILEDASQTCGDRVALSILNVGVQHRLHHFDLSDPKGLSQFLICGPMTLSILEQYARELIPTFRLVDDIEVYLGLPVMLKDRLNIPVDVNEMLFFRCSNLTEAHLEAAAARVHAQIDDLETRIQFLIEQTKWLEALEKHFPSEMVAFRKEYDQKCESASDLLPVRAEYEAHLKALTKHLLQ